MLVLNDLGDATLKKIAEVEHPVVFLAEIPDAAVVDAVRQSEFPLLLIDQAFSEATRDFVSARNTKMLDTVRTMARAQIGLNALLEVPRSLLLTIGAKEPAAALAHRIAAECGVDSALCRSMVEERHFERPLREALDAHFDHDRDVRYEDAADLLSRLDQFYGFHPERRVPIWSVPMGLMLEAVPPYLSATDPISLLGPARCLSFGPYLHLPSGRWRAKFTFAASDNKSTNSIGFDITADEEIKLEETFDIKKSGKFAASCEFAIEDSFYPFEFRTHLRRGAIAGEFSLLSLALEKCA
ncbi:hypothetical protein G4G27_01925 [Sphingomonas sp. So64.6b]|uniref:hypothetical protein n=1 Tax=Sphingomonas sp. So64.6b TaxID=2997354 RepID=UPI001600A1DF|nr:hypothetical protein [Sphingomonas sp. So64.6b]QNA82904.1 hypothetical protein G4G27_01925 [Sphingomonas sp. So64.6b]